MKRKFLIAVMLVGGTALAVPTEDIKNTVHNLSTYSNSTDQICVFCHTPHHSNNNAAIAEAPLWNKPVNTSISFKVYGGNGGSTGTTIAGTTVEQPGGSSRACLSCHDGVSGVNVLVNAPGSGGVDPNGTYIDYRGNDTTPWTMPLGFAIGKNYSNPTSNYDLMDDHPVGLTYIPGRANLASKDKRIDTWNVSGDVDGNGYPSIGDLLRNGKVECVSCHNPHLRAARFLRAGGNTESQLCLTCHEK